MSATFFALLEALYKKGRQLFSLNSIVFTSKIAPLRRNAHNAPHGPAHRAPHTRALRYHTTLLTSNHLSLYTTRPPPTRLGSLLAGAI